MITSLSNLRIQAEPALLKDQLLQLVTGRRLPPVDLELKNQSIAELMLRTSQHIRQSNFTSISTEDLGILFHAIDEAFFDGKLGPFCEKSACKPLSFRISTRMTSTGGTTAMRMFGQYRPASSSRSRRGSMGYSASEKKSAIDPPQRAFEITIASTPLFQTFQLESSTRVGGLVCNSRLEALQRVMEHEMIHLAEMLLWGNSNCKATKFRDIVQRFFGHSETNHRMLTPREIARKKMGISVGDKVAFSSDGTRINGIVNRISKRATVLVPSPKGTRFSDGKCYLKYYVPLNRLSRSE